MFDYVATEQRWWCMTSMWCFKEGRIRHISQGKVARLQGMIAKLEPVQ